MTLKNNLGIRNWLIIIAYAIAWLFFLFFVFGCNTPAKLARKEAKANEQAYQRVTLDSALHRKAWYAYNRTQPPCINDTIIGETEVLILSDTQYIRNTDTLVEFMPDTVRITVTKTNTVTQYVIDNKAVNELQDSVRALQLREASHKGQLLSITEQLNEQEKETKSEKKRGNLWFWLCMGAIALGLGSHVVRFIPSNLLRK